MNQTPNKGTPSNSTQASMAQPSQSGAVTVPNQTASQFSGRNQSIMLDQQVPME